MHQLNALNYNARPHLILKTILYYFSYYFQHEVSVWFQVLKAYLEHSSYSVSLTKPPAMSMLLCSKLALDLIIFFLILTFKLMCALCASVDYVSEMTINSKATY